GRGIAATGSSRGPPVRQGRGGGRDRERATARHTANHSAEKETVDRAESGSGKPEARKGRCRGEAGNFAIRAHHPRSLRKKRADNRGRPGPRRANLSAQERAGEVAFQVAVIPSDSRGTPLRYLKGFHGGMPGL